MSQQQGLGPRKAALFLLDQITTEGRLLSELIGEGALQHLSPEDRARAQRLATETLRGMARADRMLARFLQKTPPTAVRNVLRLCTVELAGGEAAHGVVNAGVELVARNKRTQSMKGLVNAVLRKVAAEGPEGWSKLALPRMPGWLRKPLKNAYGPEVIAAIEAVQFAGAPLDITVKGDIEAANEVLKGEILPTGSIRLQDGGQVSALPGFQTGDWWVQDAAAAIPVMVLNPQKGEKILDLCAAPGGKTMQIAASGADVTAVDSSVGRMIRVSENLKRTGLTAQTVTSDAFAYTEDGFDAILLDAPCSATGTIRRHPDLPYAKDGSEFGELIAQQAGMIDHALSLLKPGGRLVFCTCSLLPDEGEVQVDDALERHDGLTVEIHALDIAGIDPAWRTSEGGLRLRPDYWGEIGGMDGFYIAQLRKPD
ncbi:RsmB/NOP family class I SAM-dependent RNA methyltransferase [Octadecabacter sp. 1_MG-2023]|uniref:RsmB/NOP family class I SAM-dependent RNA methyltransferase n=1 Tax=unclassified Octadecabacter TaxID=196158 RepID=UPI001C08B285|nr:MULTISPECIES: RsmB/NOP family class I SAM-dependent RNA methyltransferase [unclassified Octadecabacter]MBU2992108.1 16S rRNA methyltransferase [Octadecabacter sp. B2R22]MDO6735136.1 RsmB/NOP family class I SAM-dependent RNA methyltransferase [Octadecabacter sp. 1_MG-2023]